MKQLYPLSTFLTEYKEKNTENKYKPVAVGRYGIRKRESIYSKKLAKDYSKNKLIFKNTLTVGMGSTQIDIGILTDDITYSVSPAYHTYKIRGINATYLRYCLECRNQDMFVRFVKRGSRQGKTIDLKRWLKYKIPVWNDDTQTEITYKLDYISSLIVARSEQLALFDELVKSRFIELFGDPLNPVIWEPLSDVAKLERGRFSPRPRNDPQYYGGIYPFVQTGDIANCDHRLSEHNQTLNEKGIEVSKRFKKGTILIALVGATIGATAILQKDVYAPDSVIGITVNENYESVYLEVLLRFWREELVRIAPDAARANINLEILGNIKILKSDIELQKEFVTFMKQVDKSKYCRPSYRGIYYQPYKEQD
jgi:type I restriction enzyme, S subunit